MARYQQSETRDESGIRVTELDTEVWYRIEVSPNAEADWCVFSTATYDSMITAKCALDRHIANVRNTDYFDYRLVRVTTVTEVVEYE